MQNDNLLRYNREQKYALFDCESCNLNVAGNGNKPFQWAWMIATKDKILSEKNIYVNWPNLKVSKEAARINGYTAEVVQELGISPQEACDQIDEIIYDPQYLLVAHNGLNFDIYLHNIHRLEVGKKTDYSYLTRFYDTNYLLKGYKMGMQPQRTENLLAYQYKLCNTPIKGVKTGIQTLCKEFNIEYIGAHDAKNDIHFLYEIWKQTMQRIEI